MPVIQTYHIGGSDVPVILGLSPFKGIVQLWMEKKGMVQPGEPTDAMKWGLALEEAIGREWAKRNGIKIRKPKKRFVYRPFPVFASQLDFIDTTNKRIVEIKTSNRQMDALPDYYAVQVISQMITSGIRNAVVVMLCFPYTVLEFPVERNIFLEEIILEAVRRFDEYLRKDEPPPPLTDLKEEAIKYLKRTYDPQTAVVLKNVPDSIRELIFDLLMAQEQKKDAEERYESIRNTVLEYMLMNKAKAIELDTVRVVHLIQKRKKFNEREFFETLSRTLPKDLYEEVVKAYSLSFYEQELSQIRPIRKGGEDDGYLG
jgi:putative phage-type endonuclease